MSSHSGYTFEDFLSRLERSPAEHMSPLYHENKMLFIHRPDMFTKAVLSLQWEKSLALLQAAYYTQPIAAETYRAVLARMLLHNKHVRRSNVGAFVSWKAAMSVFGEAVLAHGTSLPTRMHVSTLRLLAPQRCWMSALQVLQLGQANEQLTKSMVIEAAASCACREAWEEGLKLLMHVHNQEPELIDGVIERLRPPGTSLFSSSRDNALLEGSPVGLTDEQKNTLKIINEVVSVTPWNVAMKHRLCHSYLTHLIASTTLKSDEKMKLLSSALEQYPWEITVKLLTSYSEPSLVSEEEWEEVQRLGPGTKKKKDKRKKEKNPSLLEKSDAGAVVSTGDSMELIDKSAVALRQQLKLLEAAPDTVATLMAVVVQKIPTVNQALSFIDKSAPEALRSPQVLQAVLEKCSQEKEGWRTAVPLLLNAPAHASHFPSDLMSRLILQLHAARQTGWIIRLLQGHIVPKQIKLNTEALTAVLHAVHAHNKAYYTLARANRVSEKDTPPVHWRSALSWATDLQAPVKEDRVVVTGTGPSLGAESLHPETVRRSFDKPLTSKILSLLIHICASADSPQGALKALGYARKVDKTELALSEEIQALLYCAAYDRPYEAEAIVKRAVDKRGEKESAPLVALLHTIQEAKSGTGHTP